MRLVIGCLPVGACNSILCPIRVSRCPFPYQSVASVPSLGWAVWTRTGIRGAVGKLPVPTFTVHHGQQPPTPAALVTAMGTALGKSPSRPAPTTSGSGMLGQVTAIRTALNIDTPALQMLSVVVEANKLLGLPSSGTVPDQIDAVCKTLGLTR